MAIWVIKDGQREGPYEEQDVRELIYEGTYSDSDQAIKGGHFDWKTLGEILDHKNVSDTEELGTAEASAELQAKYPAPPAAEPPPIPVAGVEAVAPATEAAVSTPAEVSTPMQVTVVDFQMPFGSMVILMVKWVLAAIPALVIMVVLAGIFWTLLLMTMTAVWGR